MDNDNNKEISERLTIRLLIGKQIYPLTVRRDQESLFRRAASMINERIGFYEQRYPSQGNDAHVSTVMLDLAVNALQLEDNVDSKPVMEYIDKLNVELDEVLNDTSAQPTN
ncbi:MAG: cell division protein ZapA [Alloprevotella sp.]|nr:cell division protein ZapA [Alloprevotella sp.]